MPSLYTIIFGIVFWLLLIVNFLYLFLRLTGYDLKLKKSIKDLKLKKSIKDLKLKKSIKDLKSLFKDKDCLYSKKSKCSYLIIKKEIRIPLSNDLPDSFYNAIKNSVIKNRTPMKSPKIDHYLESFYKDFLSYNLRGEGEYPLSSYYLFRTFTLEEWKKVLKEKDCPLYILFKGAMEPYQTKLSLIALYYLISNIHLDSRWLKKMSYLPEDYDIVKTISKLEDLLEFDPDKRAYTPKVKDSYQLFKVICLFLLKNKHIPTKYL